MTFKIPLNNPNSYVMMCRQKLDTNRTSIELRFRFGETQALFRDFLKFPNFRKLFSSPR